MEKWFTFFFYHFSKCKRKTAFCESKRQHNECRLKNVFKPWRLPKRKRKKEGLEEFKEVEVKKKSSVHFHSQWKHSQLQGEFKISHVLMQRLKKWKDSHQIHFCMKQYLRAIMTKPAHWEIYSVTFHSRIIFTFHWIFFHWSCCCISACCTCLW